MFFAGFLAILYVAARPSSPRTLNATSRPSPYRGWFTESSVSRPCSASSGTILGGIWADQSWGRFWGWDPKENGALLIVIWCAIILHARWAGMVRERGLMALAIFGNIVTSFSWFGVNMLGVGLHAYGFMDKAFKWLVAFIVSQMALIALTMVPDRYWRSFRGRVKPVPNTASSRPAVGGHGATAPAGA